MFKKRVDDLRKTLSRLDIDAILVSNFYNILYLTGFKTLVDNEREAWLLITKHNEYVFTDHRYSSANHNLRYITSQKRLTAHLGEILEEEKTKTLAFEADDLKFFEYTSLKKSVKTSAFFPTVGLILKQREYKDSAEVETIKKACEISDACFVEISKGLRIGHGEKEIAFRMEFWLKEKGYDLAFYPIVAVDENSAIPHYDTREGNDRKIKDGSVVLVDFGAKYENYLSDITRMVFVGKPDIKVVNQYNNLLDAQLKTLNFMKPGVALKTADSFCRGQLLEAGLPEYSHATGHGVGLEIHERPKMSLVSEETIKEGQVITVEPGIYTNGEWGMRIEDTVFVTEKGVDVLTKFPKDLLIV